MIMEYRGVSPAGQDEHAQQPERQPRNRRGRPRADDRERRRGAVLDAARAEMIEQGHDGATMLGIARRAGASKETLYTWFESKEGLLRELVDRDIAQLADRIGGVLRTPVSPRADLVELARLLLHRAVDPGAIAARRAAVVSTSLGRIALEREQEAVDTLLDEFFAALPDRGPFLVIDAGSTTRLFRSLVLQDVEFRMLLGDRPPLANELAAKADTAVTRFLTLVADSLHQG